MSILHQVALKSGCRMAEIANSSKDEEEILVYAIERFLNNIIPIVMLIIISSALNMCIPVLVILVSFIPIRSKFGGSHVEKDWMCLILSILIPIIAGLIVGKVDLNIIPILIVYITSYIIAFKVGVVDNPNKRLEKDIKKKFKKHGLVVLTFIFLANTIVFYFGYQVISDAILMGVIIGFGNLLFGK